MEICSRHIGNQERPGLLALLSSPFRGAVFLWQSANIFSSFATMAIMPQTLSGTEDYLIIFNCQSFVCFCMSAYNDVVFPRKRLEAAIFKNIWK